MRNLLRFFSRNKLLKMASYNSVHIVLRIATGVIMSKVIAQFLGPSGMAVMGNFRNVFQGLQSLSVLGLENGLVRYAAQFQEDREKLRSYFSVGWSMTLATTFVLSVVIFMGSNYLDQTLIDLEDDYSYAFELLAVSLPFYVLYVMVSSLLQGFEWFKKFIKINIAINLIVFIISVLLVYLYSLKGALIAVVTTPIIQAAVAMLIWMRIKSTISLREILGISIDQHKVKSLLGYSGMALTSALLIPVTYIAVRQDLRVTLGDTAAGNWEGLQRISSYYLMFVTTLISLFILPNLSKDSSFLNFRKTIMDFYKTILPPVALGLVTIYISRDFLVSFLFTEEFNEMVPLFKWQLAGDFIKIVATVMAFRFLAMNNVKSYIIAEVGSLASFFIANYYFIRVYGNEGVVMAHLLSYLVYLTILVYLLRRELFYKEHLL